MGGQITTYTGVHMDPADPKPEQFRIEDIAHALSLICRGNGQVATFWSVGEHCLCCAREALARGLSSRVVLACLLHDAGECYLSDVPRPIKRELNGYEEMENRLLGRIYEKFLGSGLLPEEEAQIKEIDDALLWRDLVHLLREEPQGSAPELAEEPDYTVRPFDAVEREYLELFCRVSGTDIAEKAKDRIGAGSGEQDPLRGKA